MSERMTEPETPAVASASAGAMPSRRRAWVAALAGGIVAAALSGGAGEALVDLFRNKEVKNPLAESVDSADVDRTMVKNGVVAWGLQGAVLGLSLGISGAVAGRSPRRAGASGLVGLAIGGILGAASAYLSFTLYFRLVDLNSADMIPSLLSHAGVASLVGLAGGVAFGMGLGGRGRVLRAAIGGLAGAVVGSCLYDVLGAVLFPVDKTGEPLAVSTGARLLCHGLVDLLAALGAVAVVESGAAKVPPG